MLNIINAYVTFFLYTTSPDQFHLFQNPFTFGRLDEMLPKPQRESFGSPEPYHYYPSHVFVLPFSLKHQVALNDEQKSQAPTDYIVESFHSKSSKLLIFRLSLIHSLKNNLLNRVLH